MSALATHHIGLCVRDLAASVEFYGRFGFEPGDSFEVSGPDAAIGNGLDHAHMSITFVHRPDIVLELIEHHAGGSREPRAEGAVGHASVALQVDDVREACDELRAAGIPLHAAPRYEPAQQAWTATVLDPSGIGVVLTQFADQP